MRALALKATRFALIKQQDALINALQQYDGNLQLRAFGALKEFKAKCTKINYFQQQKLKQFIKSWKEIAREHSIERHQEAIAERWERKRILIKVMMAMALLADIDLDIGWK